MELDASTIVVCRHCGRPVAEEICPRCSPAGGADEPGPDVEDVTAPHVFARAPGAEAPAPIDPFDDLPAPVESEPQPSRAPREHLSREHGDLGSVPMPISRPSFPFLRVISRPIWPKPKRPEELVEHDLDQSPEGAIGSNRFSELMPEAARAKTRPLPGTPAPRAALQVSETDPILPATILGIPTTPGGLVLLGVLLVALFAGGGWLAADAWELFPPAKEEVALPTALSAKASPNRPLLVAGIDQLDALASHAQGVFLDDHESGPAILQDLLHRLEDLDRLIADTKPRLNAEEASVATAMLNPSRQLRAFIESFGTRLPDLDGNYAKLARQQLQEARVLLTGTRSPTPLRK